MAMEELHKYCFTCEDMGACSGSRSITAEGVDEFAAAYEVEKQGWLAQIPRWEGDEGACFLCPEHFAEALPHWQSVNYNPWWLRRHPALIAAAVSGEAEKGKQ